MAKQTRQAILNTFESLLEEKNFDKITVVEIVERCGINRNTFYYYFQDIYALLEAWLEQGQKKRESVYSNHMNLQDVFLCAADFVRENKAVIYHIYKSVSHMTLRQHLEGETYKLIAAYMEREAEGMTIDSQDMQALAVFYTSAMNGVLLRWLNDEMKYDLEPYIKRICRIMDGNVEQLLKKLADAQ